MSLFSPYFRKLWLVKPGYTINNAVHANPAIKNWILEHCAMDQTKKFIAKIVIAENLEDPALEVWLKDHSYIT